MNLAWECHWVPGAAIRIFVCHCAPLPDKKKLSMVAGCLTRVTVIHTRVVALPLSVLLFHLLMSWTLLESRANRLKNTWEFRTWQRSNFKHFKHELSHKPYGKTSLWFGGGTMMWDFQSFLMQTRMESHFKCTWPTLLKVFKRPLRGSTFQCRKPAAKS